MKQVALITSLLLLGILIFTMNERTHPVVAHEDDHGEMIGQETLTHL